MTKAIRALGLVAILALWGEVRQAGASETEAREFTIEVDGKACGQYVMTITKQDSGIVSMQGVANMTLKLLLRTYRYQFEGTEHWKNGRLLQLNSKSDDDGKKSEVSAKAETQSLRLRVNGQERNCRWDVWTTSYFQVADQRFHNQAVPLLDNDTGKEYLGQLKLLAAETLTLGGKSRRRANIFASAADRARRPICGSTAKGGSCVRNSPKKANALFSTCKLSAVKNVLCAYANKRGERRRLTRAAVSPCEKIPNVVL